MKLKRVIGLENSSKGRHQQGLTLIECLVAIIVIAATVAVITPAVVLAVATRVQNQRAEQAFQVAQAEVDSIKLLLERGGGDTLNVPLTPSAVTRAAQFQANVPAPENIAAIGAASPAYSTTFNSSKPVDLDGDGSADFAVQMFRTAGSTTGTTPVAFDLGVRVYRADVVQNKAQSELLTEQAALTLTSDEGESALRPIAVIYTSLARADAQRSLCDYNNYINDATGATASSPSQC